MKPNYIFNLLLFILLTANIGLAANPEAEYGKYHESWTLTTEGAQEYRCYQELTVFTHTAMNSTYGETFITYNPNYQELKIHSSYTRQKDGSIVNTPSNAFVEVLPRNAAGCPAYNHLKEMVIVHTGLELGATIYLDYSIISRPGYLPEIDVCQPLLKSSPIKEYQLTFNVPAEKTPHYTTVGIRSQPSQTNTGNSLQFKWTFRNLPALSRAPEISLQNEDIPGLLFTTYASVQQALHTLYGQFDSPSSLASTAAQLTANLKTPTEKLKAIHNYVLTHTDDCLLPLAETGYRIRPAAEVNQSAYGTEAEKANLLCGLLNAAGIPATPAAAYYIHVPPEYCGLKAIRKFTVLADADGKSYQLGVYSQSPAAMDCNFLLRLNNAGKILPSPVAASIQYKADIRWDAEQAEAEVEAAFTNNYLSYSPNFASELLYLTSTPEINHDAEKVSLRGKSNPVLTSQQNYLLLTLPETNKGIQQRNYARYNTKRQNNLLLPAATKEEYDYSIALPENLILCTPTMEKRIDNAIGSLLISIRQEGQQISVHRSLKIDKKIITPQEYPAFRQLITAWSDDQQKQLLLKRKEE